MMQHGYNSVVALGRFIGLRLLRSPDPELYDWGNGFDWYHGGVGGCLLILSYLRSRIRNP